MGNRKRRRGEGNIHELPDGRFRAAISLGNDPTTGKRLRKVIYRNTYTEIIAALREAQVAISKGMIADPGKLTVGEWLSKWVEIKKGKVENGTYLFYDDIIKRLLTSYIGTVSLGKLTALHVEQLHAKLTEAGVSASDQRKAATTLRASLKDAVRLKLLAYNVAADVAKPKAKKREMLIWNAEQVKRFLNIAFANRLYALYFTALDTGARQGELFALSWSDIDFEKGTISFVRSLEERKGRLRIKDIKTSNGRRRVALSLPGIEALRIHRRLMVAEQHFEGCPVFCYSAGKWLRKSNTTRRTFDPLIKRAGVPRIRFHDLRHTCATLLLLDNVNVKVVSERLGHGGIEMTLSTYAHVLPSMQERVIETLNRLLEGIGHQMATNTENPLCTDEQKE